MSENSAGKKIATFVKRYHFGLRSLSELRQARAALAGNHLERDTRVASNTERSIRRHSRRVGFYRTIGPHSLTHRRYVVAGGMQLESALHEKLADFHLGGEWFFLAKPVRALIDRLTAATRNGAKESNC